MRIAIGNDHSAVEMKNHIADYVRAMGHEVVNFGTDTTASVDYPVYAVKVCKAVLSGECERGILICGTGIGISIAANKMDGIRCAHCPESSSAELARRHNNANVVAFGARTIGNVVAESIVEKFLNTEFEGGRHATRIAMFDKIERDQTL